MVVSRMPFLTLREGTVWLDFVIVGLGLANDHPLCENVVELIT